MTSVPASPTARPGLSGFDLREQVARLGVWVALGVVLVVGIVAVPNFATAANADAILRQAAVLGIVALGQTFVVLTGGIDLSVGMLMGLVTVLANGIMGGDPALILPIVLLALGCGLVTGVANGLGVVAARVDPLIVTLAMLSVLQGVIFIYTDRTVGSAPAEFRDLAYGSIGPIPTPALLLGGLAVVCWVILARTPFGRYVHAVGSSAQDARKAGIPIDRIRLAAYVVCSVLAAIAGLVLAARLGSGFTGAGAGFELSSIVAVVVGGTALSGGRGGVAGTLAAVLLLTILATMLNLLGISPFAQRVVNGVVIVVAVAVYTAQRREA
ncbi:MAG: ABC transporter permease [Chloroflexi bacterium]|nr:ABC transporter permease [Chloroflexota bacterium]